MYRCLCARGVHNCVRACTDLDNRTGTVQVKGDVRLIRSKEFTTAYSLRFPRVTAVRFDLEPRDTMTHQRLLEDVEWKLARGVRPFTRFVQGGSGLEHTTCFFNQLCTNDRCK